MTADACFWHPDEPTDGRPWRTCRECGHRYETESDLRDTYEDQLGQRVPTDDIFFCPFCAHNF